MPSILSAAEISQIVDDISNIVGDDTISTDIIYRKSGSTVGDFDPTDGIIPSMYANSSVSAFKGSYTLDEVEESGGLIEYGDVKFIMMLGDVSGILSTDDMIVESATSYQSATTYMLKNISYDPLQICYFLQAKVV